MDSHGDPPRRQQRYTQVPSCTYCHHPVFCEPIVLYLDPQRIRAVGAHCSPECTAAANRFCVSQIPEVSQRRHEMIEAEFGRAVIPAPPPMIARQTPRKVWLPKCRKSAMEVEGDKPSGAADVSWAEQQRVRKSRK